MADVQENLARLVGLLLTLTGVVGFLMADYLLVFGVNALHNVIHLVTGLLGIWAGFISGVHARDYNKWLGLVYVVVGVIGFVLPSLMAELLNINLADNLLHLVLGGVMAYVGFKLHPEPI
ncbi:DUF4383 domain-containing protein [Candidatus Woesearchaeota archaeon]|nr:DUF4383 domain-containing protein [Candidatus Woesearchaeota archaeon]